MASMDFPADHATETRAEAVPATKAAAQPKVITWVTLAFMTTASVASLRSAPTMAVYGAAGGVVLILLVIGLVTYSGKKGTAEAQQKATQLTQELEAAGLRAPRDADILGSALGTDGGAVCDNPGKSLGKAILFDQLTNGGSFVGRRPAIVDGRVLDGEALILQTYCPDQLKQHQDKIADLKADHVLKN